MNYLKFSLKYKRLLIFGFVCTLFCNFGQTLLISLFVPYFLDAFSLQNAVFGTLYSAATLMSAFSLFYFGKLVDYVPLRKYSIAVAVASAFAALLLSQAHSIPFLFLGIYLLRLSGQSLLPHIATTSMARFFDTNRGKALSISNLGYSIGEGLFPLLVALMIVALGWRQSWLWIGLSLLFILVPAFWILLKNAPTDAIDHHSHPSHAKHKKPVTLKHWNRQEVLRDYRFYMILPAVVLPAFVMTGLFLYQVPMAEWKGWSVQWIATCMMAYGASRAGGSLIIGPIIDRIGAIGLYPFSLVPFALGLIVMALFDGSWVGIVYLSLAGLSVGTIGNTKSALLAEVYGTNYLGGIRSLTLPVIIFSTAVAPILMGTLLDREISFKPILLACAALTIFCILLSFIGSIGYRREHAHPSRSV